MFEVACCFVICVNILFDANCVVFSNLAFPIIALSLLYFLRLLDGTLPPSKQPHKSTKKEITSQID